MKGLIIAAGYGTRFLPVTKTIPKEMLPLIDKPSIAFIVEEFMAAGIHDIVIVSSRRKKSMEDYFDREMELEGLFMREQAWDKLDKIIPYKEMRVSFIRQQDMLGTGHALLQARALIGDSPFVCAYPDDLHFGEVPLAKQLVKRWEETGCSVMAALHNPPNLERYGILDLADDNLHVRDIVEKPAPGTAPSSEASIGRYLYTPDIFPLLQEGWDIHKEKTPGKEYFHVYALKKMMEKNAVIYHSLSGQRLDTGSPEGYLRAILTYAQERPELRKIIQEAQVGTTK